MPPLSVPGSVTTCVASYRIKRGTADFLFDFNRPAEAAFAGIEPGKLVGVLSCRSHGQSNAR